MHSRSEELLETTAYSSFPPNLQCHVGLNWTVDTTPCWHSAHSVRLAYFSNPPSTQMGHNFVIIIIIIIVAQIMGNVN